MQVHTTGDEFTQFYAVWRQIQGQPVYTDMLYQMYNVMFTAYPVMAFGILDQDVKYKTAYDTPQVSGSSRCWCPRTAICACSPGTFA